MAPPLAPSSQEPAPTAPVLGEVRPPPQVALHRLASPLVGLEHDVVGLVGEPRPAVLDGGPRVGPGARAAFEDARRWSATCGGRRTSTRTDAVGAGSCEDGARGGAMATATYTLGNFIADLDRITRDETSPHVITERVAPLLAKLVKNPGVVPVEFRRRPQGQPRGRYMLHRAPRFNVTAVVWGPRETARAHNHETWGVIGVIDNEIEETGYP